MFINHYTSCLLLHLFHVLMSIKKVQISSQQLLNRESPWAFTRKLFILCQGVKLPSEILQNTLFFSEKTSQYFCRTPLSIFAKHFTVFLRTANWHFCRTNFYYFCRKFLISFAENLSACFRIPFSILQSISQQFYRTLRSIFWGIICLHSTF